MLHALDAESGTTTKASSRRHPRATESGRHPAHCQGWSTRFRTRGGAAAATRGLEGDVGVAGLCWQIQVRQDQQVEQLGAVHEDDVSTLFLVELLK